MYLQLFLLKFITSSNPKKKDEETSLSKQHKLFPWFIRYHKCPKGYINTDLQDQEYFDSNQCGDENCVLEEVTTCPIYDTKYKEEDKEKGMNTNSDDLNVDAQINFEEYDDVSYMRDDVNKSEMIAIKSGEECESKLSEVKK